MITRDECGGTGGRSAAEKLVVSSYGDSTARPRIELDEHLIDDDGKPRSHLAVVGLELFSRKKEPGSPGFDGISGGAFRFVGSESEDLLFEDNKVVYGELVVQNATDVTIRRNVVYRSYRVGTCATRGDGSRDPNGNPAYRPSGIFAGKVDGLIIEENVWDENGWNPDVAEACATIYNHDLYLSGNHRVRVDKNLILRASSIGVKMAASGEGGSTDIRIRDNVFAEGEIGLSMGGNGSEDHRFADTVVSGNVFTDIGRARPTTRTLTWYIDIIDNDGTVIEDNLLVNQPDLNNPYGIQLSGDSNRDVVVRDNVLRGLRRRHLVIRTGGVWDGVEIRGNQLGGPAGACLVDHDGAFTEVAYRDNAYDGGQLCTDAGQGDLGWWRGVSGETGASEGIDTAPDPGRNLDSYAAHLGVGTTLADFAAAARGQSRLTWDPDLTADAAVAWIREGFGAE